MSVMSATRYPPNIRMVPKPTEFQIYTSLWVNPIMCQNVFDITAVRLASLVNKSTLERKKTLQRMLIDYTAGHIAVAWQSGEPISVNVQYDK